MIRILKFIMLISRLPLSLFFSFQVKRHKLNKLSRLQTILYVTCLVAAAGLFIKLPQAQAAFAEQIAIDPRAISLANTVTADPPGISSIHYNPAGLSDLGDGNLISMGAIPASLNITTKFEADPSVEPFHDFKGDLVIDQIAGTKSTNASGRMYIPLLDITVDAMAGPVFGVSHRNPGSKWTFAYSAYAPYAGGWESGNNSPARYEGQSVTLQHLIYAGPAISYKINNNLSIGGSFGLGQSVMNVNMEMRSPNELTNITKILGDATHDMANPIFDVTIPFPLFGGGIGPYDSVGNLSFSARDDFAPSYNLGVLWEPLDWLSFGAVYQSSTKAHLSGKYKFKYNDNWQRMVAWEGSTAIMQIVSMIFDLPYEVTSEQTGYVTRDVEWPQMASVGIKLKPVKRLSLLADLHWAQWSSIKQDNFVFDQKIQLLQVLKFMGYNGGAYNMILVRNLKDTLNWSVGIEYQALDWLSLRAGYENRTASTRDEYYDALYAIPSLDYFGAGLGIKWKSIDIDLALGYMVNKSYKVPDNGSVNMNSTQLGSGLNNPYRGLNYEQETAIYMGGLKATMPLDIITGMLYKGIDLVNPFKRSASKGSLKAAGIEKPVDSSATIINNLRYEGNYYYTEDIE
ncbi:MAG: TonB-dependent receptor [Deltaproteobacteria bacterium]|nr:TonB-dependent receptor [Deltaproteobacteria bacterium]